MAQSRKTFEKKVLAELTGKAKSKAETIESTATAVLKRALRYDDDQRGQMHALGVVIDQLAELSIPRTIALVDKLLSITNDTGNLSPARCHQQHGERSYVRVRLNDTKTFFEGRLKEKLAKGPVRDTKPTERAVAFATPLR
jgi:hypothetical protein